MPLDVSVRLRYLRVTVAGAYVCGILLSPGLWFSVSRTFPRAPLLNSLPAFLLSADYLLSPLLLAALILAAVSRRPRLYLTIATAVTALLVVLDQTRLQPWVYQYLVMLVLLACLQAGRENRADDAMILAANQWVIAALYFWSGAQKLNWSFAHEVVPAMLEQADLRLPTAYVSYLPVTALGAAICEALIGVGLLLRWTRRTAMLTALGMHFTVLLLLVAASHNSVVWTWNLSLMVMDVLLFRHARDPMTCRALWGVSGSGPARHVVKAVIILCVLAPALSFVGMWDMYLSAALYSGTTSIGVLRVGERVRDRLPAAAQRQIFTTKRGELMLPFYEWSLAELNVPPYPEMRVYRNLARQLCEHAEDKQEIELIVKERPSLIEGSYTVRRAGCQELSAW